MNKLSDSDSNDQEKIEEASNTEGSSYPFLFVIGLVIGSTLGGGLLGVIGAVIGGVFGGGIGGALQSLVSSRRDGGSRLLASLG